MPPGIISSGNSQQIGPSRFLIAAGNSTVIPSGIGFDLCDWCSVLKLQRFSGKYESKPIPLGMTNVNAALQGGLDKAGELLSGASPSTHEQLPANKQDGIADGANSPAQNAVTKWTGQIFTPGSASSSSPPCHNPKSTATKRFSTIGTPIPICTICAGSPTCWRPLITKPADG